MVLNICMEDVFRDLLKSLCNISGTTVSEEVMRRTPERMLDTWRHLLSGYSYDENKVMTLFRNDDKIDEIILLRDIELYSICEHHLLPFFGKAHVAYIPAEIVVKSVEDYDTIAGASKLARVVDMYSRRLQIQERICEQVTTFLMEKLNPKGAACIITAVHFCMRMRGVAKQNSTMVTSSMKGVFREKQETRQELLELIKL